MGTGVGLAAGVLVRQVAAGPGGSRLQHGSTVEAARLLRLSPGASPGPACVGPPARCRAGVALELHHVHLPGFSPSATGPPEPTVKAVQGVGLLPQPKSAPLGSASRLGGDGGSSWVSQGSSWHRADLGTLDQDQPSSCPWGQAGIYPVGQVGPLHRVLSSSAWSRGLDQMRLPPGARVVGLGRAWLGPRTFGSMPGSCPGVQQWGAGCPRGCPSRSAGDTLQTAGPRPSAPPMERAARGLGSWRAPARCGRGIPSPLGW